MLENLKGLSEQGEKELLEKGDIWTWTEPNRPTQDCMFVDAEKIETAYFKLPEHQAAFSAWKEFAGDDLMPPVEALDPLSMVKALGSILIICPEIHNDKQDFRYRLYGSTISDRFGADLTGKLLSDFPTTNRFFFAAQYQELLLRKVPFYGEHDAPPDVSVVVRWARLALPFGHKIEDGSYQVDRIVVCNVAAS